MLGHVISRSDAQSQGKMSGSVFLLIEEGSRATLEQEQASERTGVE
jgi:hypothetical protein